MKKLILFFILIISIAFIFIGIYNMSSVPTNPSLQTRETQKVSYIIKEYGGKLAVYPPDENEPLAVYDIYIHLLPENDIELLRYGISVYSELELQRKLEDFGL